jgi:uncharacterized protein YjbI with pentapeptide repeats
MSPENLQGWVAVIGGLLAAILGVFKYFNYRSRRDRLAEIGASFALTVEALASNNPTSRMAGAVLLRRFFDRHTEQGARGRPYVKEAVEVMAGMLRQEQPAQVQKVLADGFRYSGDLRGADLQNCDLSNAYLGKKHREDEAIDLSRADLYGANCERASFRAAIACEAVFVDATLRKTVFTAADCRDADFRRASLEGAKFESDPAKKFPGADLRGADFRDAELAGATFADASVGGARFEGANGIPDDVAAFLDDDFVARHDAVVPGTPQP